MHYHYPDLASVRAILVVKMGHHGDLLLTSPVLTQLKKKVPHARIDMLLYRETLPMLEGHPAVSHFLPYDRAWKRLSFFKKLAREVSLLWKIRQRHYDLVLNLSDGDRGAIAAWVSGGKYRVGFDPEGKGFLGKRRIYTHIVKKCKTVRHTVEQLLDSLRCLGIFPTYEERELFFHIPPSALEKGKTLLHQGGVREGRYLVIHPVSRWRFKCCPPQWVAELISQLHMQGHEIVLTGSSDPTEMEMIEEIIRLAPSIPLLNVAGRTTLKELGALIQLSRGVICVDSLPLHLASCLKIPVVALFGPSSEKRWGPWRHPRSAVITESFSCRPCLMDGCGGSKRSDCLQALPVENVLRALEKVLV